MLTQKEEGCLFFVAPGECQDIFLGRGGGGGGNLYTKSDLRGGSQ